MFNAFSSMDGIMNSDIGLEVATKMSDRYPMLYPVLKDSSEKEVINKTADMILENKGGLSAWIGVFWNGKYSKARTLAIENDKAVLMLPEPIR